MAKNFRDMGITITHTTFIGDKIKINKILNREITVHEYKIEDSKKFVGTKCMHIQFSLNDTKHVLFTSSKFLIEQIGKVKNCDFPFTATIVENDKRYEFI